MSGTETSAISRAEPTIAEIQGRLGCPDGIGFSDVVRRMVREPKERLALEYLESQLSYGEVLSAIGGLAKFLESKGVSRGSRVAYMFRGHPHALYTLLAVTISGAILCPMNHELKGEVLQRMLERYAIEFVVADEICFDEVRAAAAALSRPPLVLNGHAAEFTQAINAGADVNAYLGRPYPKPQDPGLILSTSGTTGLAKGVLIANTWGGAGAICAEKWDCFDSPPKEYVALSWGYSGAIWQSTMAFMLGGSVVIPPRFSASRLWEDFHSRGCTHIHLMGTMPRMLMAQPEKLTDKGSRKIIITSAGMPADIWQDVERRFNARIYECFSAVDSGGCWLANDGSSPPGSVGKPWVEMEGRVVDDNDNDVPMGEVGELVMRPKGGQAVVNYLGDPAASAEKTKGGWVHFGDYFRKDEKGDYWFVDRKRDLIRRRAMSIAPNEIEQIFRRFDRLLDIAVFAVPSELGEDEIKIVIVPKPGDKLSPTEVAAFADESLARYMRPRYIEVADELPRTFGSSRVQRFKLREQWANAATWDAEAGHFLTQDRGS